jgi:hypothetical protein
MICLAAVLNICTPLLRQSEAMRFATSFALSDCGKSRLPRSVLSGSPCDSKKAMVSAGEKRLSALYRKRPSPGTLAMKVLTSQLLQRLHRPLPVMRSLRPSLSFGSSRTTLLPR